MARTLFTRVAWAHPEWWAIVMSAAAWASIAHASGAAPFGGAHDHGGAPLAAAAASAIMPGMRDWLLMIVAMMFPLAVGSIQATAARSLWRRRHRAIACWLMGYTAPWIALGVSLWFFAAVVFGNAPVAQSGLLIGLAFAAAAIWQGRAMRARAVHGCHRTQPLAPTGWRANYDCVRYGWTIGVNCVAACGAMMVACWLVGHGPGGLFGMITVTAVAVAERWMNRPDQRVLAGALGVQAIVAAVILPW